MDTNLQLFANEIEKAFIGNTLLRILLSKPLPSDDIINRVQIKMVEVKREKVLTFVYEYPKKIKN